MSEDPRVAFEINFDLDHVPQGKSVATLEPFPGSDAISLISMFDVEVPDPLVFVAKDLKLVGSLDYLYTDTNWPIMSRRMFEAIASLGELEHRRFDVTIQGGKGASAIEHAFVAVQLLQASVDLDFQHARVEMDPKYRDEVWRVIRWRVQVPENGLPPLFRVRQQDAWLFVSAAAKQRLEAMGVRGARFSDLDQISTVDLDAEEPRAEPQATPERAPRFTELPLSEDDRRDLSYAIANGSEIIGGDPTNPEEVVPRVRKEIDRYFKSGTIPRSFSLLDYEAALAGLWAESVVNGAGWKLVAVEVEGERTLAVVSPDRRYIVFPFAYIPALIEEKTENNTALLYNMIKAKNLPEAEEGDYVMLS
jgi:hypothetical protein